MATSTKRIYGPNGEVYESVVGSDGSVTERVIQAQSRRIQGQTQRAQQEAPVLWDANGKIRQVGGGTYRPRRIEANNSLGRGDRVQLNDGAVSSTPSTGNLARLEQNLQKQATALTEIARGLGFQTGAGDPNLDTQVAGVKDVLPRRPRDTYFDESSGTLFFWDIETDPAAGTWKPIFQVFQTVFTAPDSGQIDALSATVHVDGAIAINPAGEIYTGERAGNTWTKLVGGGTLTIDRDPNLSDPANNITPIPVQEDLLLIDKTNGDQWYADNSDPQTWTKLVGGGTLTIDRDPNLSDPANNITPIPVQEDLLVIDKTNGDQYYADNSTPQVWTKQPSGGVPGSLSAQKLQVFSIAVNTDFDIDGWTVDWDNIAGFNAAQSDRFSLTAGWHDVVFTCNPQVTGHFDDTDHRFESRLVHWSATGGFKALYANALESRISGDGITQGRWIPSAYARFPVEAEEGDYLVVRLRYQGDASWAVVRSTSLRIQKI